MSSGVNFPINVNSARLMANNWNHVNVIVTFYWGFINDLKALIIPDYKYIFKSLP